MKVNSVSKVQIFLRCPEGRQVIVMSATEGISAFGTLLYEGSSGSGGGFGVIAEVQDIAGPALALALDDATHHESPDAWEEFIPTVKSTGDITFPINYIPTEATHDASTGLVKWLNDKSLRDFKIVFPDATEWPFSAFVTGFTPMAPVKGKLTANVSLKISGAPTLA